MTSLRSLLILAMPALAVPLALGTPSASAATSGPNLATSFVAPSATLVGSTSHYEVRIANTGNRNAGPVTVTVDLPKTNTSPDVLVMGQFSGLAPSTCSRSGVRITCSLPGIARGASSSVAFDIRHPYSVAPIAFHAEASTANDTFPGNNAADFVLGQTFHTPSSAAPAPVTVRSCTGRNLISFFECTSFPTSIQQHQVTLAAGGLLDFSALGAQGDGMGGTWSVAGSQLTMTYTDGTQTVGTFVGQGASAGCWEGRMTFTSSSVYVAMYEVCR